MKQTKFNPLSEKENPDIDANGDVNDAFSQPSPSASQPNSPLAFVAYAHSFLPMDPKTLCKMNSALRSMRKNNIVLYKTNKQTYDLKKIVSPCGNRTKELDENEIILKLSGPVNQSTKSRLINEIHRS